MRNIILCKAIGHFIIEVPSLPSLRRIVERTFPTASCVHYPNISLVFECPDDAVKVMEYTDEAEALTFVHELCRKITQSQNNASDA